MIIHKHNTVVKFGGDIVVGASLRDGVGILTFKQLDEKLEIGKVLGGCTEDLNNFDVVFKMSDVRSIDVIVKQLNELKEMLIELDKMQILLG